MRDLQLLWVDLRCNQAGLFVDPRLTGVYRVHSTSDILNLSQSIRTTRPEILCFDYDFPKMEELQLLLDIRNQFPDIPILMLAKEQSVELALWALRSRVYNYFIKPVAIDSLIINIENLLRETTVELSGVRRHIMPQPLVVNELRSCRYGKRKSSVSTQPAADYVIEHSDSKLTLDVVAGLCCMSKSHFSRKFKKDHGVTFQEFLVQQRINKAATMLKYSNASITEVALTVGFRDLSHFTRTFHKCIGMGPSCFRSSNA